MRSCLARDGSTSTIATKANCSTAVDWSCKIQTSSGLVIFHSDSASGSFAKLPDLATFEELPNDVGQPGAWSEPVDFMLIDVR